MPVASSPSKVCHLVLLLLTTRQEKESAGNVFAFGHPLNVFACKPL
jgi:hypothetical protein